MAKKLSPMTEAILETAGDLHALGIMSDEDYNTIAIRYLGEQAVRLPRQKVQGGYRAPSGGSKPATPTIGSGVKKKTLGWVSPAKRGVTHH